MNLLLCIAHSQECLLYFDVSCISFLLCWYILLYITAIIIHNTTATRLFLIQCLTWMRYVVCGMWYVVRGCGCGCGCCCCCRRYDAGCIESSILIGDSDLVVTVYIYIYIYISISISIYIFCYLLLWFVVLFFFFKWKYCVVCNPWVGFSEIIQGREEGEGSLILMGGRRSFFSVTRGPTQWHCCCNCDWKRSGLDFLLHES